MSSQWGKSSTKFHRLGQWARCHLNMLLLPWRNTALLTKNNQYPAYKPCQTPDTTCVMRICVNPGFLPGGVVLSYT